MRSKAASLAVAAGLLVALALLLVAALRPVHAPVSFAYHWPVKPFDRQHPIRGAFGDPRTLNMDQPLGQTAPNDGGAYSFHTGVDIVAAPGTPVYPVVSGVVVRETHHQVRVNASGNRQFEYWHLRWNVKLGQNVVADQTVLGWIRRPFDHVHVGEVDGNHGVNPLRPGRMTPYADHTTPRATALDIASGDTPKLTQGGLVGPHDTLAIDAVDAPAMPVRSGPFAGLPQTPALVQWRLRTGSAWGRWHTVADWRRIAPEPYDFWNVYAPGTYQNVPVFDDRLRLGVAGRYLFRVALDPGKLRPGAYELEARVADIRGNSSTTTWPITIAGN